MMHLEENCEWFATWFDSPYYHLLYDNRNDEEAAKFIRELVAYLNPEPQSKALDLACGAGRHSRVLNDLGLQVTGCDLSANSIQEAIKNSPSTIRFFEHDMRDALDESYDIVFNLFTSFGYFDQLSDNLKVLKSIYQALPNQGVLVLDFMNSAKVIADLKRRQEIQKGNIHFNIQRTVTNGRIVKTICFDDNGKSYYFQEKVQALNLNDFQQLFDQAGFQIETVFGNYNLEPYNEHTSDRLLFICRKV